MGIVSRRVGWIVVVGLAGLGAWAPAAFGQVARSVEPPSDQDRAHLERAFSQHVASLSSPWMEGRAPGTDGHERAAEYIAWEFQRLGLKPAFSGTSYFQEFKAPRSLRPGDSIRVLERSISYGRGEIRVEMNPGVEYGVLGCSGDGDVSAPLVFVGYSIEEGKDGYTNYPGEVDLSGKIAVMLRYEPMTAEGTSRFSDSGWSSHSDVERKWRRAVERKAAGVMIINPSRAKHPRAGKIEDTSLAGRRDMDVPVVMVGAEAGDAMLRAVDPQGRGLAAWQALADEPEGGVLAPTPIGTASVRLKTRLERVPTMGKNVGGLLPGRGALAQELIVVGGHFDHLGYGYFGSRDSDPKGKLHPGADDNASGTSGVLLAARLLGERYRDLPDEQPARSVLFLAFSAEESGLNGSKHYCEHPIIPLDRHALMVNMDMIGRLREGKLEVQGVDTAEGMREWVQPYFDASAAGGLSVSLKAGGSGPSDHASFYAQKVPVLFFFTGLHTDYHAPSDTFETINTQGGADIAELVARIVLDRARYLETMAFRSAGGGGEGGGTPRGVRVRFGIAPGDYSGSDPGVLVGDVFPDTPAAKAGLQKGDVLLTWNGKAIEDVEGWMPMLAEHNPGDEVSIGFRRDGVDRTATTKLVGRGGTQ